MIRKTMQERAQDVLNAYYAMDNARIELEDAKSRYDFAIKQTIVARDNYIHLWELDYKDQLSLLDFPDHQELDRQFAQNFAWRFQQVRLLSKSIRQACQTALRELKVAHTSTIVSYLESHGYEFTSEPGREVVGTLLKQPWARRNAETGDWKFVPENT